MNSKYADNLTKEKYLKLWVYLLPIVGAIPAIWTLGKNQGDKQQQKVSRISIILLLVWLGSYCSLSLGAGQASDILAFRLLYTNALITTGYFLTCTLLMLRLSKVKIASLSKVNNYIKSYRE